MTESFDAVGAVAEVLTEHGPLREDEIVRRLLDIGVPDPEHIVDTVLDEIFYPVTQLADERWAWLPALLLGRVFTHRVEAAELAHDMIASAPDLDPIIQLCEHDPHQQLADGSPVRIVVDWSDADFLDERGIPFELVDDHGALVFSPGTLAAAGVQGGDLVGLRLTDSGLIVERVAEPRSGAGLGARLTTMLDPDGPILFTAAVLTACSEDPELFTAPLPPLAELIADSGLANEGDLLARDGFDFALWRFAFHSDLLTTRHDIDGDDANVLVTLLQAYDRVSEDLAIDDDLGEVASELAYPLLAVLFVEETIDAHRGEPESLLLFAEAMEPKVARSARPAWRWLRASAMERMGDVEAAEREYLAAESMDTDWAPTLFDLARFASDRGDIGRALALLRRAGADDDNELAQILQRHQPTPRADIGRNDLCWCGSGRKYKKCHQGNEQLALPERARWLYYKACQHVASTAWNDLLVDATYEREVDDGELAEDPLPMDAVLFEGGALDDFLKLRGFLLPDDERLLAEQWTLVDRSVYEVEEVRSGSGVTVRDLRTGDTVDVRDTLVSRHLEPANLFCGHVLPTGDGNQFFGGIEPLTLPMRDSLIELLDSEPDPMDLVAFLARPAAPPTLTNTEGEPLAMCEATIRVDAGIVADLDDTYDRVDGQDPPEWLEHIATDGTSSVRAALVLDDDTVRVRTNSEERMDRVLATLARLDPSSEVLDDTRHQMSDADDIAAFADQLPGDEEPESGSEEPEVG